jgi:hypothetical protein
MLSSLKGFFTWKSRERVTKTITIKLKRTKLNRKIKPISIGNKGNKSHIILSSFVLSAYSFAFLVIGLKGKLEKAMMLIGQIHCLTKLLDINLNS